MHVDRGRGVETIMTSTIKIINSTIATDALASIDYRLSAIIEIATT